MDDQRSSSILRIAAPLKSLLQRFAYLGLIVLAFSMMLLGKIDAVLVDRVRAEVTNAVAPALGVLRDITVLVAPESEYFTRFIWDLIAALLFPSMAFLTFLLLYRYLPNTDVLVSDVWPGALLASMAFTGANVGFVWYVRTYPFVYNVVYGSVGAVIALLTWVYLSAIILLFGAILTSRYASYAASLGSQQHSLKILWTGFSRVRLRIVEPARAS